MLDILKIVDKTITDFNFMDLKNSQYALIVNRGNKEFAFNKESSGIKKILLHMFHLMICYDIHNVTTMTISDELDSSISTMALIKLLNGAINSSSNISGQFLLSSHNPLIFDTDMLSPAQIYIVDEDEELSTIVKPLSIYELRDDKRKAYLDYLRGDYD